jgi:hypothetical protein
LEFAEELGALETLQLFRPIRPNPTTSPIRPRSPLVVEVIASPEALQECELVERFLKALEGGRKRLLKVASS